jgi:hypothetical protein
LLPQAVPQDPRPPQRTPSPQRLLLGAVPRTPPGRRKSATDFGGPYNTSALRRVGSVVHEGAACPIGRIQIVTRARTTDAIRSFAVIDPAES